VNLIFHQIQNYHIRVQPK